MKYFALLLSLLIAPAAWPCTDQTTCTYNFLDSVSTSPYGSLQDGGSVGTANSATAFFIDGADVCPFTADEVWNSTAGSATGTTYTQGWRTSSTITGGFRSGNWQVHLYHVASDALNQTATCYQLKKGSAADGSNAVAISSQICGASAANSHDSNATLSVAETKFTAEYLFITVVWQCNVNGNTFSGPVIGVGSTRSFISTPTFYASAPAAPTGLTTSINSKTSLHVAWGTVSNALSYKVLQGLVTGSHPNIVATPTASPIDDTGLIRCEPYFYVVHALNPAGESGDSSEVTNRPYCDYNLIIVH